MTFLNSCLYALLGIILSKFDDIGNFVVGHAPMRMNNCLIKTVVSHFTTCRYLHLAHHRQSVDFGLQ